TTTTTTTTATTQLPSKEEKCFTGDTFVIQQNGQRTLMRNLNVGDHVLVSYYDADNKLRLTWSPILAIDIYQEYNPNKPIPYLDIHTAGNQAPLRITSTHSLLVKKQNSSVENFFFAKDVYNGDNIYTIRNNMTVKHVPVIEVKRTLAYDAYAPLTNEGNLVVNDVIVSCYGTYTHRVVHLVKTPKRLWCRYRLYVDDNYMS
ncbi:unnamed protein product, partial [Didymodactylos carnosus]